MAKKIERIVWVASISFFVFLIVYAFVLEPFLLMLSHRYTIATIKEIKGAGNGGPDAFFEYSVDGKSYKGFFDLGGQHSEVRIGNKYYLEYYPPLPKMAKIVIDKMVTDTLKPPYNGWE